MEMELAYVPQVIAYLRSLESQRKDALFRDPHVGRIAKWRGDWLGKQLRTDQDQPFDRVTDWFACQTALMDRLLLQEIIAARPLL
jgi:O-methyltransferase involved in polyketide biosynthesis